MTWKELTIARSQTHHIHKETGVPAYSERFDEVLAFHAPGLAPVQVGDESYHIDMYGKPVYSKRFQRCFGFYDGIASVITKEGWRHISPDGTFVHGRSFVWSGNFQEGICTIRLASGHYVHIDKSGRPLYTQRWCYAGDFRYGIGVVQNGNGVSTHIDTTGNFLHGQWFCDLDVYHKGYARAKDEQGWMHIDRTGSPIYKERFAMVEPFYNGQARVETLDGALLVIDEQGQVQRQLRYATSDDFAELSADMVGFWKTQTIATGVELGVFDLLPMTLDSLVLSIDSNRNRIKRLLGALGELGLVTCAGGVWNMTKKGQYLATNHPKTLRDAALEFGGAFYQRWTHLPQAIRDDWSAPDVFAEIAEDAERVKSHTRMIQSYAKHDYPSVVSSLLLTGNEHIVDVGGGSGALAKLILQQFPDVTITVLERPEIVELMEDTDQLRWVAVDIFESESWNIQADVVICSRILHDWNDRRCQTVLQGAKQSLKPTGRLFIIEMVLSESFGGRLCDLHLLTSSNGKERTLEEYASLLDSVGLTVKEHRSTESLVGIIEAEYVE